MATTILQEPAQIGRIQMTIPTINQVLGADSWQVLKGSYLEAEPTGLAVALGGDGQTGYITKSASVDGLVLGVDSFGDRTKVSMTKTAFVRLVLPAEEVKRLNLASRKWSRTIVFGEYPQSVVSQESLIKKLNALRKNGRLKQTGKEYTFWSKGDLPGVIFHTVPEYRFKGEKYVLLPAECLHADSTAYWHHGVYVMNDQPNWIRVDKVEWLKDRTGNLISEKALFSMPMGDSGKYDGFFRATGLARFLRDCMGFEILPTEVYQTAKQTQRNLQNQVLSDIKSMTRSEIRRYFAGLNGEARIEVGRFLAGGTPKRDQMAAYLKQLRRRAYDDRTQAGKQISEMQMRVKRAEKLAREEEAEGRRLLKKYMAAACTIRREAADELNEARKNEAKAVKVADRAQAGLRAYWQKRQADRTIRIREE